MQYPGPESLYKATLYPDWIELEYVGGDTGEFTRLRIVALSAVKNDYALVATAVGPYHEFSPDFGIGHPSGVNLALAMDMGKYVNSFRWRSGPAV